VEIIVTRPGAIVAATLDGVLWTREADIQLTAESEVNGLPGWHGPGVQAADVDGDGRPEVLYLTRSGRLEILDGATGETVQSLPLQAPSGAERWEHLVVANFRGLGDRDLLLQATNRLGYRMGRYVAALALTHDASPRLLWQRDDFVGTAHGGARVLDLDGDGRDEVVGASILRWDGEKVFDLPIQGHLDAITIADVRSDQPGLEIVAIEEGGGFRPLGGNHWLSRRLNQALDSRWGSGNRVFLYGLEGLIWEADHLRTEPQNVAVGDFVPARAGLEIWCRSRYDTEQRPFIFDAQGQLLGAYELSHVAPSDWTAKGIEVIFPIHWTGGERQLLVAKARHESGDVAIMDALTGRFLLRVHTRADRLFVADVLGDWREEIIVVAGSQLQIYANDAVNPRPDGESLWEQRHYRRMKQTWNYYAP
jgi:hypothetical protein